MSDSNDLNQNDRSARIVVAGHICIDLRPQLPPVSDESPAFAVTPGTLVNIGPSDVSPGGCVSNVGLALHNLGMNVAMSGKVGDDLFGKALLDLLAAKSEALAASMITSPGAATSYSIVVEPPGIDRAFLHCSGANDTFTADDLDLPKLGGAALFHFGYPPIMPAMIEGDGVELAKLFERVRHLSQRDDGRDIAWDDDLDLGGPMTSLDMSSVDPAGPGGRVDWPQLLERTLPNVDLFIPSFDELLFMLDRPAFEAWQSDALLVDNDLRNVVTELADHCLAMGAGIVAIKMGDQGLYAKANTADRCRYGEWAGGEYYRPCYKVDVVGTTGSGDCTVAGLLAALAMMWCPTTALDLAAAVGASGVEAADATSGVPDLEAIDQRINAGWASRAPHPAFAQWRRMPTSGTYCPK